MHLGSANLTSFGRTTVHEAAKQRGALQVLGAKKGSSPWSSGGPKRGSGKGGGAGSNNSGSSAGGKGAADGRKASNSGPASGPGSKSAGAGGAASASGSPWKDAPGKRPGLPARGSVGGVGAGAAGLLGGRLAARLRTPPETTITDPVEVTLLDELSPTESAAEPKWGTFCNHLGGEWVGQYAAYTPWEGKPEPAWLDERGKYINVVYTRAHEYRYQYDGQQQPQRDAQPRQPGGPGDPDSEAEGGADEGASGGASSGGEETAAMDVLIRRIGRCTRVTDLPNLRLPSAPGTPAAAPAASTAAAGATSEPAADDEGDGDVEALAFNTDGIVVFDGGNYSAGPEYVGQQQVRMVNDDAIEPEWDQAPESSETGKGGADGGARTVAKGATAAAGSRGRNIGGPGSGADDDEDDDFGDDEEGVEEGEDEEGSTLTPTTTSVFEQCLVDWGSRTRLRLKLTLRIGQLEDGEVDVEVLRILLFREEWLGAASSDRLSTPLADIKSLAAGPITDLPRPTPAQLQGAWNVFTVCATGLDEADPVTGEEGTLWVYSSTEEQQLWDTSTSPPSGEDGGSYWLPGGVVLSLRMLDNYIPAGDEESSSSDLDSQSGSESENGNGNRSNGNGHHSGTNAKGMKAEGSGAEKAAYPRGLCVSMAWLWREGSVSIVEREYDGYGFLREVRLAQGVKGGWSGGRM